MNEKILQVLQRKLLERSSALEQAIASGAAPDYAAYQNLVGQVRGLAAAQMETNDLLRKLKEAENDD